MQVRSFQHISQVKVACWSSFFSPEFGLWWLRAKKEHKDHISKMEEGKKKKIKKTKINKTTVFKHVDREERTVREVWEEAMYSS